MAVHELNVFENCHLPQT